MTLFPLPLEEILGHWGSYLIYLVIGIAFGAVLEMAGFGNSRKLAGQFYFKDMTVLKVMFTGIIVAMGDEPVVGGRVPNPPADALAGSRQDLVLAGLHLVPELA